MKSVQTTIERPSRITTWAWGGRFRPGYPTAVHRQRNDTQCDKSNAEPAEQ
ncbi:MULTISPECIES: hypothetical protein [Haloarcula]|uniref:hypothetical protein n=1 Tax=Haloarcula TaxID=2237 RepID=UPI0016488EC9|nr:MULTISPECIES: hypothetical protein [Haloarcula]